MVLRDSRFQNPRFCKVLLDWCEDKALDMPEMAIARATAGLALAETIGDRNLISKGYGLLSTSYRVNGDTAQALSILDEGEAGAGDCPCCLGDLDRRRGIAALYSSEMVRSIAFFDRAITHFEQVPDPDGIARVKVARGLPLFHEGHIDAVGRWRIRRLRRWFRS